LDQVLTQANVTHQFNVYPGTMHAFHNDTGATYNQDQAVQAWKDTIAWFARYVKS
jgi:carboxymethylenebutenolidase